MQLQDRLVLVTGASSGIGEATVKVMASRGAKVLLLARREAELGRVATAIVAAGGDARPYTVDLSDPDDVADVAARIRHDVGVPDVIVNNAGAGRWAPLAETSPEEVRAMVTLPYLAAAYVTGAFLPEMVRRGSGHIASVTSPASYLAWPGACGYIAARHALRGFTDGLRADLAGTGVGVTLVVLGTVESSYWAKHPGSRENVPKPMPLVMPVLTTEQAAATIVQGVESGTREIVRPRAFRALFVLNALLPGMVARSMARPGGTSAHGVSAGREGPRTKAGGS